MITRRSAAPYIWEATGTFALAYTVGVAGVHTATAENQLNHSLPLVGLSIGTILAVMVYAGGAVSGGHYNPAVTLGCMFAGATPTETGLYYMMSQLFGACVAGLLARASRGDEANWPDISEDYSGRVGSAFLMEFLFTYYLVLTVLNTAVAKQVAGNNYFGLAIGYSVFVGATCIGPYSGGAMNPAVGVGLQAVVNGTFQWIYVVAPLLGGAVASVTHVRGHPLPRNVGQTTDYFSEWRERLGAGYNPVTAAYVMEFTGTFYLSLTVAIAVAGFDNASASEVAPFAIGSSLMIAVYFGGHVSGGHYNPAVSLGCGLIGKLPLQRVSGYIVTQLAAAFAAAGVADNLLDGVPHVLSCGFPTADPTVPTFRLVLCETIFTFFLVTVVMFTATTKRNEGNDYYGFAIGMTVFVGAVAIGGVSGAALNPAVGTALPIVCGKGNFVWVYWVGPCLGAAFAAGFYILVTPDDFNSGNNDNNNGQEGARDDEIRLADAAEDPYVQGYDEADGIGYASADAVLKG